MNLSPTHREKSTLIGWGERPIEVVLPTTSQRIELCPAPVDFDLSSALERGIEAPVGTSKLREQIDGCDDICVIISDETRKDVSSSILPLLTPLFTTQRVRILIAAGKHPYRVPPDGVLRHRADGHDLIPLGTTRRGTPVSLNRAAVEADLVIAIGEIRPHYFAGYAGGAKSVFPGIAGEEGIWKNHLLKAAPGARLGQVSGNPCRADMEEAAAMVGPLVIINVVRAHDGSLVDLVIGDPVAAHRDGVRRAKRFFEIPVDGAFDCVLVSDRYPVTTNLYQACKLLPPAGALLNEGGTIILAAQCGEGLGPVEIINESIYRLGVIHSLPRAHRVILVSEQGPNLVRQTFAEYAPDVASALSMAAANSIAVLPFAGDLVPVTEIQG